MNQSPQGLKNLPGNLPDLPLEQALKILLETNLINNETYQELLAKHKALVKHIETEE